MNIMIFGASGLVGRALFEHLSSEHRVTVVGRDLSRLKTCFPNANAKAWSGLADSDVLSQDAIINLSGENIASGRWSDSKKQQILDSRRETTARLAEICAQSGSDAPVLLNASAIGIYGLGQPQKIFDELSELPASPTDFLARVGQAWEQALHPAESAGCRVLRLRFGVILAEDGGALSAMLPSFRFGLGATLGTGQQAFSWVTLKDVVRAIAFLLTKPEASGPYNIVSAGVCTQVEFAKSLARYLQRPCLLRMPACAVRILYGQMGEELLLQGVSVKATRLRDLGFEFHQDTLDSAWPHLFHS